MNRKTRNLNSSKLIVVEDEEPITVTDDVPDASPAENSDDGEIEIEDPTPDGGTPSVGGIEQKVVKQESAKHALASRLYHAIEAAYGSVYELTDVLNEIARGYRANALKQLGNASLNLQGEIEALPGLLDGRHEKEDVARFMGLMDQLETR